MELSEELESLSAIFGNDISYSEERDGKMLVNIFNDKKLIVTLLLKEDYPSSQPDIQLSLQYSFPELEQCITDAANDSIGAPMLFQMVEAAQDWLRSHPGDNDRRSREVSPTAGNNSNVCKFFKGGKCKFGDKCKFLHPVKGFSPPMSSGNGATAVTMAKHKPKETACSKQAEEKYGTKAKANGTTQELEEGEKKTSMRSATDVISRILWDGELPTEEFTIGYLDRFVGIIEKPFAAFSWEDIASVGPSVLSVPKHRIQYFKYRDQIVWDKRSQMDNFFGSRGNLTIDEIVSATASSETDQQNLGTEAAAVTLPELSPIKKQHHDNKDRPTHFLCIHVSNQEAVSNIQSVQDHITTISPQLAEGLVSPRALHITLCMIRLENDDQISKARAVLEEMKSHFLHMLPRSTHLLLNGVDNFKDRLIYAKVAPNPALSKLVFLLIERLQVAGLRTPGNHSEYTPHVTIVKMSRPMQRELNTRIAGQALYSKFQDKIMGRQQVQTIDLCSMHAPKQDDGFFQRFHTISNSLLHLTPAIQSPLMQTINSLCSFGKLSEREKGAIVEAINSTNEKKFEQALKIVANTQLNDSTSQQTAVVILRGLPGSGKSFLATNSLEYLRDPSQFTVCSADEFFMKDGIYQFTPEQIPEAHVYCLQKFLNSVTQSKFLIVDNTNSQLWEYQVYTYLCEILHLDMQIIEIPCPTDFIANKFQSRNVHNIDATTLKHTIQRWEKDERAVIILPKLAYPSGSARKPAFSIKPLIQPDRFKIQLLDSFPSLFAVYTGIFLTTDSQWLLVSTYSPVFPNVQADHVTLCFAPSITSIAATKIGQKVKVRVMAHEASNGVQAVRVQVPGDVHNTADLPHITISTDNNVSPKTAAAVLSKHQVSSKLTKSIVLEGTIGIVVRQLLESDKLSESETQEDGVAINEADLAKLEFCTVTSRKMFQQRVAKKLYPSLAVSSNEGVDVSIHTGSSEITDIFLFDFDGTLFHTPCPEQGKAVYEEKTGKKWPHRGWWSCPESMLPPLEVYPGPSIADFRSNFGCASSKTFILTARNDSTRSVLKKILEHASIFPDRILTRPNNTRDMPGYVFKGLVVKDLLSQFPSVTRIKFWDDMEDNLKEVNRVVKLVRPDIQIELIHIETPTSFDPDFLEKSVLKGISLNTRLETNLTTYSHLPSSTYSQAARVGVQFLVQQFSQVIDFEDNSDLLAYPFGSFPLGRSSDVDLCLLAPPTHAPMEFAEKLATQLKLCGVKFIHIGRSSRCPRLKVSIHFNEVGAIDYDIVFAVLKDGTVLQKLEELSVLEIQSNLKHGDSASKAAFMGPVFLHHVKEAIQDAVSESTFAAVVEMMVQILRVNHLKGNAYHCIRTFHIIQLLADFIKSRSKSTCATGWNADSLFKAFAASCSQLSVPKWKKLFGEFVPGQYIDKIISLFIRIQSHCEANDFPTSAIYHALRTQVSISHKTIKIKLKSSDEILLWIAASVIEAKLPSYIRKLLDSGIDIIPCPTTTDETTTTFCFAVPEAASKEAIQEVFRPFWAEVSEFRQNENMSIDLVFESSKQVNEEPTVATNAITRKYTDLVVKFYSSEDRELHLSSDLNSYERRLVHEAAERMGVSHKTVSKDGKPHIVLQKLV